MLHALVQRLSRDATTLHRRGAASSRIPATPQRSTGNAAAYNRYVAAASGNVGAKTREKMVAYADSRHDRREVEGETPIVQLADHVRRNVPVK